MRPGRRPGAGLPAAVLPVGAALGPVHHLEHRQVPFIIATSADSTERDTLLKALGRTDLPFTDSDAVASSKPAPDLLLASCRDAGIDPREGVIIGDAPWDARAARRAGLRAIAVRCGGFSDDVLLHAGAERVVDTPP